MVESKYMVLFAILMFILGYFLFKNCNAREYFNDTVGRFCYNCQGKTINQCTTCANCGFCVDRNGNSNCVSGDHNGPYNCDDCVLWYYGDDWARVLQNNRNKYCR